MLEYFQEIERKQKNLEILKLLQETKNQGLKEKVGENWLKSKGFDPKKVNDEMLLELLYKDDND